MKGSAPVQLGVVGMGVGGSWGVGHVKSLPAGVDGVLAGCVFRNRLGFNKQDW